MYPFALTLVSAARRGVGRRCPATLGVALLLAACDAPSLAGPPVAADTPLNPLDALACRGAPAPVIRMEAGDTAHIWFHAPAAGVSRDALIILKHLAAEGNVRASGWSTRWPGVYDRATGRLSPAAPQTELASVHLNTIWPLGAPGSPAGQVYNMNGCDVLVLADTADSSVRAGDAQRRFRRFDIDTGGTAPASGVTVASETVTVPLGDTRTGFWRDGDRRLGVRIQFIRPADPFTTSAERILVVDGSEQEPDELLLIYKVSVPPGPLYVDGWDVQAERPSRFGQVYRYKGKDIRFIFAPS